ncbi:helix-hairpin-helix domain-containing protein [Streptomyces sp. NPDC003327]
MVVGAPHGEGAARARGDALFPAAAGPEASGASAAAESGADSVDGGAVEGGPGVRERLASVLRERTPVWVQTRCGLEPRTLAALSVVLVVAAGAAGGYFWSGRPETVRAPEVVRAAPVETVPVAAAPTPSGAANGGGGARQVPARATGASEVVVDVGGKVRSPGVLTLPAGSRVADAVRAAGGAKPEADLTGLNRARVLMDGEQVLVGVPGPPGGGAGTGAAPGAGPPGPPVPLSLNAATVEQLDALPGVGPVLARHIVDHRTEHGGFRTVAELREVNGIGERRFADLEPLVRP